jgi:hypothetical protein
VDQQEDEADYQPDDWEGVEDALEDGFQSQFSVLSCLIYVVILCGASANALAESKDPLRSTASAGLTGSSLHSREQAAIAQGEPPGALAAVFAR